MLNLASITWAFISLLRHIPGFCPVGQKNGSVAADGSGGSFFEESIVAGDMASDVRLVKKARRRREFTTLRNVTFCHATMGTRVSSHSQRSLSTCRSSHLCLAVSISSSISECLCPKHLASRSSDCCAHLRHRLPGAWGACELCEREATSYPGSRMLRSLCFAHTSVQVVDARPDKFFRVLGRLILNGKVELGKELVRRKLAVQYFGEARSGKTWCT